jgi:hypothetical protein
MDYRLAGGNYPLVGPPNPPMHDSHAAVSRESEPTPVVLVAASSPRQDQVPPGALKLVQTLQSAAWAVRCTYALAERAAWRRHLATVAKDGSHWRDIPAETIETLAVRFASPGRDAAGYAIWTNKRFDSAWIKSLYGVVFAQFRINDLHEFIKG